MLVTRVRYVQTRAYRSSVWSMLGSVEIFIRQRPALPNVEVDAAASAVAIITRRDGDDNGVHPRPVTPPACSSGDRTRADLSVDGKTMIDFLPASRLDE